MPHLVAILIYLSQIYSYYIKGDRSPLNLFTTGSKYPLVLGQLTLTDINYTGRRTGLHTGIMIRRSAATSSERVTFA